VRALAAEIPAASSRSAEGARTGIPACIDHIATRFAEPPWDKEIVKARLEFDRRRGEVCDDEELYDLHVAAFLEWYVLERPTPGGAPPVVLAIRGGGHASEEETLLRALAHSHRSLFEVLQIDLAPCGLQLLDLPGGGVWRVDTETPTRGLARGDIFEARLIPWAGRVLFGPVFCFHPREASSCIHDVLRQARGQLTRADLLFALAQMRLRYSRMRNIAVGRIYALGGFGSWEEREPPAGR
jgi:hypothetical protein